MGFGIGDVLGAAGLGRVAEDVCNSLGLPDWVGDCASLAANGYTGNWLGIIDDVGDLAEEPPPAPRWTPPEPCETTFRWVDTGEHGHWVRA